MKYFIPLLILSFIIILIFAFTVKAEAQVLVLPNRIEINYCGKKLNWDYLNFRSHIIATMEQGKLDPCEVKGYIKMLNTEHSFKRLVLNPRLTSRAFFRDLNTQIKTR